MTWDFAMETENAGMGEDEFAFPLPTMEDPPLDAATRALVLVGDAPSPLLAKSMSPVFDALVYCAVRGWGVQLVAGMPSTLYFWDFPLYYHCAALVCRKKCPTRSVDARVKAIKRWFSGVPRAEHIEKLAFYAYAKDMARARTLVVTVNAMERLVQGGQ
jgi:hypothetical protein